MQTNEQYKGDPLNVEGKNGAFIPNAQQQNQQQGSQSQIGSKDLSMIEDMLNHEAMAYKKCTVFANYFTDETLTTMASTAAAHHKQHFEALQSYMSQHK